MTAVAPIRVLLVDDTPDIRMLLRVALEIDGFEVVDEAGDGRAGVHAARETQPDVVLLDLAMPVMDGLEALPLLREASPASKVIVLSGFQARSMEASALAAGADAYLQKGVTPDEIIACVRSVMGTAAPGPPPPTVPAAAEAPWAWLAHAPVGVVLLDGSRTRILRVNAVAAELLSLPGDTSDVDAADLPARLAAGGSLRLDEVVRDGLVTLYLRRPDADAAHEELQRLRAAIASTAHEIRNPVGTLIGIAQTLSTKGDRISAEVQAKLLSAVGRQARLLDRVTGDLLTASQAERGHLRVQAQDLRLLPAVEGAIASLELDVAVDVQDVVVHADAVRVDQMLMNLLSNAAKYGRPPFRVRTWVAEGSVRMQVEDSGDGVPEAFRSDLFMQFARAEGTRVAGSGIGLYIVRSLAEAQGGTAWYAPLEQGSAFGFSLPLV